MKKSQGKKEKKKPKNFQERFEGKKKVVGKGGLYELLDLHQPFSLEHLPIHESNIKYSNQDPLQEEKVKNKRLNLTQKKKPSSEKQKSRTNKTQIPKRLSVDINDVPKLPKITKTGSQKSIPKSSLDKLAEPQNDYWNVKKGGIRKRVGSELNFRAIMHADYYAVEHFEVLQKFEKRLRMARKTKLQL